ncbi:MAG: CapA family protein [Acidimicrobiia bacterium]
MTSRTTLAIALVLVVATSPGCGTGQGDPPTTTSLLFTGDLILGRGVAPVVAANADEIFSGIRHIVSEADIAMVNLESPLTRRPHSSANPFAFEADPAGAGLISSAGFDVVNLANNHAGDAGPASITDTIDAVRGAGMSVVGAGADSSTASAPLILEREGIRVAVLAIDATGDGLEAGDGPGVVHWDPATIRRSVEHAAAISDILVVSLHGGVEYLPDPDPRMTQIAGQLVEWGADVVWGHGPHVRQIVSVIDAGGRAAIVAPSLGNLLFDQRDPETEVGSVLEVLAGPDGIVGYRVGTASHHDLRVGFSGWTPPVGNAFLRDGEWWSLVAEPLFGPSDVVIGDFPWGDVVAAGAGHVTGGARDEIVVSFRKPATPHPVRDGLPEVLWRDPLGRTAHLGIYQADDLSPIWVAGMVPAPVGALAVCDGSLSMAYTSLDDPTVIATGAAVWRPGGLDAVDRLPGHGVPGCFDVDRDGALDPVVVGRG